MKFFLIDQVIELSETQVVACKQVARGEDYLADHFPTFPVMPGVLMLEALVQSATVLLHHRRQFACAFAVLKEARTMRYGQFVSPGMTLRLEVDYVKDTSAGAAFKALGTVNGQQAVSGRIELAYFNMGDRDPSLREMDHRLIETQKQRLKLLHASQALNGSMLAQT